MHNILRRKTFRKSHNNLFIAPEYYDNTAKFKVVLGLISPYFAYLFPQL